MTGYAKITPNKNATKAIRRVVMLKNIVCNGLPQWLNELHTFVWCSPGCLKQAKSIQELYLQDGNNPGTGLNDNSSTNPSTCVWCTIWTRRRGVRLLRSVSQRSAGSPWGSHQDGCLQSCIQRCLNKTYIHIFKEKLCEATHAKRLCNLKKLPFLLYDNKRQSLKSKMHHHTFLEKILFEEKLLWNILRTALLTTAEGKRRCATIFHHLH